MHVQVVAQLCLITIGVKWYGQEVYLRWSGVEGLIKREGHLEYPPWEEEGGGRERRGSKWLY